MSQRFLLIIFSALVSIIFAEIVSRIIFPTRYYLSFPNVEHVVEFDHDQMPGIGRTARFQVNSLGLRGGELQKNDQLKILALGGSTTEMATLDQPYVWSQLIEEKLEDSLNTTVWVGNAGKSGLNSRHHAIALDYYLSNIPEIKILVVLVGINDLLYRLGQDVLYDPDWHSQDTQGILQEEMFEFMMPNPTQADHPFKRWHLYQLARRAKQQLLRPKEQVNPDVGEFYQSRRQERLASEKIDVLPDLTESLTEYRSNLKILVEIAKAHSVEIVLMTQPVLWQENMAPENELLLWMGKIGEGSKKGSYYAVPALAEGMNRYNEILLEVCQTENLECIDLSAQIPKTTEFLYDDTHFNETGSAQVASIVSDFLVSRIRSSRFKLDSK